MYAKYTGCRTNLYGPDVTILRDCIPASAIPGFEPPNARMAAIKIVTDENESNNAATACGLDAPDDPKPTLKRHITPDAVPIRDK